jgi:hypothetical protein
MAAPSDLDRLTARLAAGGPEVRGLGWVRSRMAVLADAAAEVQPGRVAEGDRTGPRAGAPGARHAHGGGRAHARARRRSGTGGGPRAGGAGR